MRNVLRSAPLAFALTLALASAASAQTQDSTALPAQLKASRVALQSAYTSLAPLDAATHYADSIVVEFGTEVYRGKAAASSWLQDALVGLSALRLAPATFHISADEVVETTGYTIVLPDGTENGGTTETVWRRQGTAWKVTRMTVR